MELAAACDLRISTDTAIFGMPEVRVGLPSVIEAALLPRLIGWGKSNYLVLTAENINATTAYEWGFLESICTEKDLEKQVTKISDAIACSGPIAVRSQKALVAKWEQLSLEDSINKGIDAFEKAYKTDEPQQMMQPFLNRKTKK
jgi:enoyl-CoA hydratase/carnithine racemase